MQTHELFPTAARARVVSLMLLGHLLSREPRFEGVGGGLLDLWMHAVIPYAISRYTMPIVVGVPS